MADYNVSLGIDFDDDRLSKIKNTLEEIEGKKYNIKFDIDDDVDNKIDKIKSGLKELNKSNKGSIATESLEKSLTEVSRLIANISRSIGTLNTKKGTSIVTTVNHVNTALQKASKQFEQINKTMSSFAGKDFVINFDLKMGNANPVKAMTDYGRVARESAIPDLEKQVVYLKKLLGNTQQAEKAINSYFSAYHGGFEGLTKKNILLDRMKGLSADGGKASIADQMSAYKQFVGYLKEIAQMRGINLDGFDIQFPKTADEIIDETVKIQSGVDQTEKQFERLKQIFGGSGVDAEKLSAQLQPIIDDLGQIRTALVGLPDDAAGGLVNGLTQNFNKLSDALDKFVSNIDIVKTALNSGNLAGADSDVADIERQVEKSIEKKKQEAKQAQKTADIVEQSEKQIQQAKKKTDSVHTFDIARLDKQNTLESHLEKLHFDDAAIEKVTSDLKEMNVVAKSITTTFEDGKLVKLDIDGVQKTADGLERIVKVTRTLEGATVDTDITKVKTSLEESDRFIKQRKKAVADLSNQIKQVNRSAIDPNAERSIKDKSHLASLETEYNKITAAIQRMQTASSGTFDDEQINVKNLISDFKSLVREYKNAENIALKNKGVDIDSGLAIAKNNLDKLKSDAKGYSQIAETIEKLDEAITGVGDKSSLDKFNNQLRVARSELDKIKSEERASNRVQSDLSKDARDLAAQQKKISDLRLEIEKLQDAGGKSNQIEVLTKQLNEYEDAYNRAMGSFMKKLSANAGDAPLGITSKIEAEIEKGEAALEKYRALGKDIQALKIRDIELKLDSTGANSFHSQVEQMHKDAEKLNSASVDLGTALDKLDNAYEELRNARGDTSDDGAERLIVAEEKYQRALEETANQLKENQRIEKNAFGEKSLNLDKAKAQLRLDGIFEENSAAAKVFGERLDELKSKLNSIKNDGDLKLFNKEIDILEKDVKNSGLSTQTFGSKFKEQFQKYSQYFSVAEVFMYVEEGLRDMFEQVKLIDSAMTELKKVTNESDAAYNQFLSNAASRSKEIGTTIDGLVNSTADFARLGYDFVDSQGLAEVANIYAVVGDEVEGVEGATESLISTMAAFKGEMDGMSNSDFAMNIIDKFNEIGNNFAISSGGIGEALERSASSMYAANNTLDESIALITAAM